MQRQRGTIGSFPETLSFDHGSTSTSAVDQQVFWNNMHNPPENRPPECMPSPAGTAMTYANSTSHEQQISNAWSLSEPSSHGTQNKVTHDERLTQLRWSPLTLRAEAGSRLEEQQCESSSSMPVDGADVNPLFVQSSNSNGMSQILNINSGFVSHDGDNFQVMGYPNLYKSGASENEQIPPPGGSETFLLPSESVGYLAEGNNCRPGSSFEGGRRACKRKVLEGNVENSSASESSSYLQHAESSARPPVSASNNGGSSLSISAPSGQVNSGLGLSLRGLTPDGVPDSPEAGNAARSRRNLRVRINPPNQPKSMPYALLPTGAAVRHSSISSAQQSSRLRLNDQSLDTRTASVLDNVSPQRHPVLLHVPVFPQNLPPFQLDKGSSSRTGSSSSSNAARGRDAFPREETRPITMDRSILENPMLIARPDLRNLVRDPANRSLAGGNRSIPGNVASSSRAGSSSSVHPPPAPTWVPHPNPSQYPRRYSELLRRSLISSISSESVGQSSNQLPLHTGSQSPEEMVLSSRAGNQRHHQYYPRSASQLERHDGVLGFPHPLRALAAAGEGRNRLVVSEIRNVLDLMRRGEGLRFEDVMILDQSVFFGMADIHDRHRDMRLDVDNMSYEELLALEERIGNVNTGLSEETIKTRLKQHKYCISMGSQQEQEPEPCCICQEEYNNGEDIGTLDCGHDFHTHCIKQWLMNKNLCPICKTTALSTS